MEEASSTRLPQLDKDLQSKERLDCSNRERVEVEIEEGIER